MTDQAAGNTRVILDWGPFGFRASLLDEAGKECGVIAREEGVGLVAKGEHAAFAAMALAPFRGRHGPLDIVAVGMIGSRNGWLEMPYVRAPATVEDLAAASRTIDLPGTGVITFLPGLTDPGSYPFPDVMRGEETQLVGLGLGRDIVAVLPGAHVKWAEVRSGRIERFRTFATGEIFATLASHSFLSKIATSDADHQSAVFARGVALARAEADKAGGLLNRIFAVRTGWLAGEISTDELKSLLWGILVGWEFVEAQAAGWFRQGDTVAVVGDDHLVLVYETVARGFGLQLEPVRADVAIRGALEIAARAGRQLM